MLISELIEQLIDIQSTYPDAEVRLAMQPAWPFEYSIHSVTEVKEEKDTPDRDEDSDPDVIVYLSEGVQLGYLPGAARDAVW